MLWLWTNFSSRFSCPTSGYVPERKEAKRFYVRRDKLCGDGPVKHFTSNRIRLDWCQDYSWWNLSQWNHSRWEYSQWRPR